jgi:hypothetical protein
MKKKNLYKEMASQIPPKFKKPKRWFVVYKKNFFAFLSLKSLGNYRNLG